MPVLITCRIAAHREYAIHTRTAVAFAATTLLLCVTVTGCSVLSVADAAVSVTSTAVKIGADAVGVAADVARAGVKAVTGSDEQKKK